MPRERRAAEVSRGRGRGRSSRVSRRAEQDDEHGASLSQLEQGGSEVSRADDQLSAQAQENLQRRGVLRDNDEDGEGEDMIGAYGAGGQSQPLTVTSSTIESSMTQHKDIVLPYPVKTNTKPTLLTRATADEFIAFKKKFLNEMRATGVYAYFEHTFEYMLEEAIKYNPRWSRERVSLALRQASDRLVGTIRIALASYADHVYTHFKSLIEQQGEEIRSKGLTGEFDVYLLWQATCQLYEKETQFCIWDYYNRLAALKWDWKKSRSRELVTQIHHLETLAKNCGDKVEPGKLWSDYYIMSVITKALPSDWDVIRSQVSMEKNLTIHRLTEMIDQHRDLVLSSKEKNGEKGKVQGAFHAKERRMSHGQQKAGVKGKGGRGGKDKSRVRCFNCDQLGHYSNECKQSKQLKRKRDEELSESSDDGEVERGYLALVKGNKSDDSSSITVTGGNEKACVARNLSREGGYDNDFYLDSGASMHLSSADCVEDREKGPVKQIMLGDGKTLELKEYGTVKLSKRVKLNNVGYHNKIGANLISVSKFDQAGCQIIFQKGEANIFDPKVSQDKPILTFRLDQDDLYVLQRKSVSALTDQQLRSNHTVEKAKSFSIPKRLTTSSSGSSPLSSSSSSSSSSNQSNRRALPSG